MSTAQSNNTYRVIAEEMTVREVLKLPSFAKAKIVAGSRGLDRRITNAMILEAADIEKWGREGMLLITSLFALEPLSESDRLAFLDKLETVGVSGIVFKPARLLNEMPDYFVQYCEGHAIPIIQVSSETKYESILMDVMGSMIDSSQTLLSTYYQIHQRTMQLEIDQCSTYEILASLKKTIHQDATYFDKTNNAWTYSNPEREAIVSLDLAEETKRRQYQTFHYFQANLELRDGTFERACAVLIPNTGQGTSYLIIHATIDELTGVDIMAVENFVNLLQVKRIREQSIEDQIFQRNNSTVHDLIMDRFPTKEEKAFALRELGMDSYPNYQSLLVRFSVIGEPDEDHVRRMSHIFYKRLKQNNYSAVFFETNNRVTYLVNFARKEGGVDNECIARIVSQMRHDPSIPSFRYLIGVSEVVGRDDIAVANDQTTKIYRLFGANRKSDKTVRYEDLGMLKTLLDIDNPTLTESYIDSRVARLKKESPDLFETLSLLCSTNLDYQAVADELYLHPKTVRYRVNRIKSLYGIDVHCVDDLTQVVFALKVYSMLGE